MSRKNLHLHSLPLLVLGAALFVVSAAGLQRLQLLSNKPNYGVVQNVVGTPLINNNPVVYGVISSPPPPTGNATASAVASQTAVNDTSETALEQASLAAELSFAFNAKK